MPLIVFEGMDGSGKSTLIKELTNRLVPFQIAPVLTREPGGTPLGDKIRELLLDSGEHIPLPRTELLLYEAARAQHVDQFIKPHLSQGAWVFCDRYVASSLAFQWGGRGLDRQQVELLNQFATGGLTADLTILLDLSPNVAEKRRGRRSVQNRLDQEKADFHQRVKENFLIQAQENPSGWLVLNSDQATPAELAQQILQQFQLRKWI